MYPGNTSGVVYGRWPIVLRQFPAGGNDQAVSRSRAQMILVNKNVARNEGAVAYSMAILVRGEMQVEFADLTLR